MCVKYLIPFLYLNEAIGLVGLNPRFDHRNVILKTGIKLSSSQDKGLPNPNIATWARNLNDA